MGGGYEEKEALNCYAGLLRLLQLAENLKVRNTIGYRSAVDSVVHLIILVPVGKNYDLIVLRKGLDESSCRRNYHLVLTLGIGHEEHTVVVVILLSVCRKTLDKPELGCELIGRIRLEGVDIHRRRGGRLGRRGSILCGYRSVVGSDSGILRCNGCVVLGNDAVLLVDGGVIAVHRGIIAVDIVVICEGEHVKFEGVERTVEEYAVRRAADVVDIVPETVVDAVVIIVIYSPVAVPVIVGQMPYPVAVIVGMPCVEAAGTVVRDGPAH